MRRCLGRWRSTRAVAHGSRPQTLGSLIDLFEEKGFAVLFVVLMAPSALPLPTGGVTNMLEVVTMLLALELIAGKRCVWLPQRWNRLELGGRRREKFASSLLRQVRRVERLSHPHLRFLFGHRLSGVLGILVFAFTLGAFVAPPFSGLDAALIGDRPPGARGSARGLPSGRRWDRSRRAGSFTRTFPRKPCSAAPPAVALKPRSVRGWFRAH